jgi:hypothetical protein
MRSEREGKNCDIKVYHDKIIFQYYTKSYKYIYIYMHDEDKT